MSDVEEQEQQENCVEMTTKQLINIVSHHRIHDADLVLAAKTELDARRTSHEASAELEGLVGVIQAANRKVILPVLILLMCIGSFISWSYYNKAYQDWTYLFMLAGMGLVMIAVKMMEKKPYIKFNSDSIMVIVPFGKTTEYSFNKISGDPKVSGNKMTLVTATGEQIIDLSPLTEANRKLFINTLTARLNTLRT